MLLHVHKYNMCIIVCECVWFTYLFCVEMINAASRPISKEYRSFENALQTTENICYLLRNFRFLLYKLWPMAVGVTSINYRIVNNINY